ncbi:MAG: transcriptional regulator GcvA [Alphaproteobacteria bacterium]|nr:transcriptional regulator GcvA [Alphaproteobacteria bacterium]
MRLPSLRAIQAFDAVARHGNFSRAADELAVTHGAVSRQVRGLEEHLGMRLFRRTAKGAELTDSGATLFRASKEAFMTLHSGVADLTRRSTEKTITVSLPTSLALKWVVPRLPDFRSAHPELSVLLDTNDNLIDFQAAPVDVGLRFGKGDWQGLYLSLLAAEELVAVASPNMVDGMPLPLDASAIKKMPLIHDDYNPSWEPWFEEAGASEGEGKLEGDRYGDTGVLIAAAIDGQAVALVRRLLAADDLSAGRLVQISEVTLELEQSLYFVCRPGDQKRPAVRTFLTWLRNKLADEK